MVVITFDRSEHARTQHEGDALPHPTRSRYALLPALSTDSVQVLTFPCPLNGRIPESIRPSRHFHSRFNTLVCAVVSRALLRLTAKHQPGRALQHGGLLLPLRGRERFRLPRHPPDRRSRTASRLAWWWWRSPRKRQTLALGAASLALLCPERHRSRKGEPEHVCQSRYSHWIPR